MNLGKVIFNALMIFLIIFITACKTYPTLQTEVEPCKAFALSIDHPEKSALQKLLDDSQTNGLVGISVIVQSDQGLFYGKTGKANLHNQVATNECQRYRIASLTKPFVATAIMLLVEKGQLTLNTPINEILSESILKDIKRSNEATIATLLGHTSGLANYDDNPRFAAAILNEPGKEVTIEQKLDLVRGQGATPDWVVERFGKIYSNINYILLQLILEEVTAMKFEDFIRDNILKPLDLNDTYFSTEASFPNNLANGYIDMYDNKNIRDVTAWDASRFQGEGCMISTVFDVYHFYTALLQGEMLKTQTVEVMKSQLLGLLEEDLNGQTFIGHDGQAIGYSAEMWYNENNNLLIIMLANQGRISEDQPSIQVFEKLLKDIVKNAISIK